MAQNKLKNIFILLLLSYIFLMLGNGALSLTNPDEVFYTQTAKEMIEQKTWSTPYLFGAPQFEKPIFLYWAMRVAFLIFGISSFGARFAPAFFGVLGVIALYYLGLLGFKNDKKAFFAGVVLASCGLYIGLSRTVFTDMIFSVFILLSLLSFYAGYAQPSRKGIGIICCFVFSGLAVLTKGPLGFFIPSLVIISFLMIRGEVKFLLCKYSFWGILAFIGVSFPWYILMIQKYGVTFTQEFFYNDHIRRILEAEHKGNDTWYFYPMSMVGCMFPWSLYSLGACVSMFKNQRRENPIYLFLSCWIIFTFIIFQFAHSKLVSYIFPLFPALAMITADFIYDSAANKGRVFFIISVIMLLALLLMPPALIIGIPYYAHYISSKVPIYILAGAFMLLTLMFAFFLFRRRFFKVMFITSLLVPTILFAAFYMHSDAEPFVSSRNICKYLMDNYSVGDKVISSKVYARGVKYYTGKEIAVMEIRGRNYFSPHPIPFLDSEEKVREYLKGGDVIYCVLRKSGAKHMQTLAGKEFKFTLLKVIGDEYLVKMEKI